MLFNLFKRKKPVTQETSNIVDICQRRDLELYYLNTLGIDVKVEDFELGIVRVINLPVLEVVESIDYQQPTLYFIDKKHASYEEFKRYANIHHELKYNPKIKKPILKVEHNPDFGFYHTSCGFRITEAQFNYLVDLFYSSSPNLVTISKNRNTDNGHKACKSCRGCSSSKRGVNEPPMPDPIPNKSPDYKSA